MNIYKKSVHICTYKRKSDYELTAIKKVSYGRVGREDKEKGNNMRIF